MANSARLTPQSFKYSMILRGVFSFTIALTLFSMGNAETGSNQGPSGSKTQQATFSMY